nr:MAG TPA: helix-turn-helix domain protein [Caudoviricetes sp.]
MDTCANRIKDALKIRKMSQAELCEITGIPKSAVSQYCSGAFKPKQDRTFLIANALNVDEAWLMGFDVPMDKVALGEEVEKILSEESEKRGVPVAELRGIFRSAKVKAGTPLNKNSIEKLFDTFFAEKEQFAEFGELSEPEKRLIELFRKFPKETQDSFPALLEASLKAQGLL